MVYSRLRRGEERRQKKRLIYALVGSVSLITFIFVFGLKILVAFSLFVDKLRGNSPATQTVNLILPPVLNPLPEATNSAKIVLSGTGQAGLNLIVYINEKETKKVKIDETGDFSFITTLSDEGLNIVSGKLADEKGNLSNLSNVVSVAFNKTAPNLELSSPTDNLNVTGEKNLVTVSGKVKEDISVTVNGRLIVIKNDGTFSYDYPLNEGDNNLKITAIDVAGNQTVIERKVIYKK